MLFRLPETGAYADRHGHLVEALPDDGRASSPIGRDRRELGVLLHDPGARPAAGPAARRCSTPRRWRSSSARLRVELRLQLAEVESSRARIAQAGYEERRRLERDLHDGAQQRLVTLGHRAAPAAALAAERREGCSRPRFDAAVDEVAATIADLRTIAAGVRPPRLDAGLAAALEDLARGAAVPVDVDASGDRAPPEVEAVAYFIACEALTNAVKHASPSRVSVQRHAGRRRAAPGGGRRRGRRRRARARARGWPGMADRVAAQGGTLALESPAGAGTRIAVELPCAS